MKTVISTPKAPAAIGPYSQAIRKGGTLYLSGRDAKTGQLLVNLHESTLSQKVAVVPGTAFGECGEGFIRVSYSYSLKHLTEALGRMKRFVASLRNEGGEK